MSTSLPSLFLSHGAPDLLLVDHPARTFLEGLAGRFARPRVILMISAHWEDRVPTLMTAPNPRTVHDFSGFQDALYDLAYPAVTDAVLVERTGRLLEEAGIETSRDPSRGLDHGAWVPLLLVYPQADVPVVQLSLVLNGSPARHFEIGRALAPLRGEGVLIIGSGGSVHNLRGMVREGTPPPTWATDFDHWIMDCLETGDLDTLLSFPTEPETARFAHPTAEHLLPLFVAAGAGWDGGETRQLHQSYSYGSVGMASFAFGNSS